MTYTLKRYQSYEEYLNAEELVEEKDYRLLDTGEVIELASEERFNRIVAYALIAAILEIEGISFIQYVCRGDQELQVKPLGDRWVNRKPDVMILSPEHLGLIDKAIVFDMPSPLFVAEIVSPGNESTVNYKRDYVWKRKQYEWWQIPEYWIIDPHRAQVTVLTLVNQVYQKAVYQGDSLIASTAFPALSLTADKVLAGTIEKDSAVRPS